MTSILIAAGVFAATWGLAGCQGTSTYSLNNAQALAQLSNEPLPSKPWSFGGDEGNLLQTAHFRIYTTIDDRLYQHLLVRVLEGTHDRVKALNPGIVVPLPSDYLDCYVFRSRGQWENYTRARGGSNAPIYLQISAGGYCQEGVFAGYDIGREQTLSVIAHEAWHQYSWFAFKDRLPSWLEEGMATQNEGIEWDGAAPHFRPEQNWRRFAALRQSIRDNSLWKLSDLLSTHAGRVIKLPQQKVDGYYAQLWSLVLFLEESPKYRPRLQLLLADAAAGKLARSLEGTSVTKREIDNFTEHWNSVAGPLYLRKYLNPDMEQLEQEYVAFIREFANNWPPAGD